MYNWSFLNGLDIFSWQIITLLIVSGFLVGFINTVAGNGTIISFTLFMGLGLPANISNGSIRLGVIIQTLASTLMFKGSKLLELKDGLKLGIPATVGSIVGAQIAISIDKDSLKFVLGLVLVLMLILLFYKPDRWLKGNIEQRTKKPLWAQLLLYFIVGAYGGFIHVGVGLFLLAALVLFSGYDLVRANGLKVFIVLLYSPFTLAIFMISGQIDYKIGLISAIGNIFGGIIGSRVAINKGANFIRWFIAIIIVFSLIDMFKLYRYITI